MLKKLLFMGLAIVILSATTSVAVAEPLRSPKQPEAQYTQEMAEACDDYLDQVNEQNILYDQYVRGEIREEEYQAYVKAFCDSHFSNSSESLNIAMASSPIREDVGMSKEVLAHQIAKPMAIGDLSKKFLDGATLTQENGYYCGPASAKMVVDRYKGKSTYTQKQLANMLGTTTNGTGLGSNWLNVFNKNIMGRDYIVASGPRYDYTRWVQSLTSGSIISIYYGRGVIYNVHMYPGAGNYLVGYNWGDDLYHYVAGCGYNAYDPSARQLAYVDPVPASYRPLAHGTHTVSAHLVGKATHPMGAIF